MDNVDAFFVRQELALNAQLHHVVEKYGEDGLALSDSQGFIQDVELLRKHTILNIVALFKIVKKHDKNPNRQPLKALMVSVLLKKRIAKSLLSSLLFETCEPYMAATLADDLLCVSVRSMLEQQALAMSAASSQHAGGSFHAMHMMAVGERMGDGAPVDDSPAHNKPAGAGEGIYPIFASTTGTASASNEPAKDRGQAEPTQGDAARESTASAALAAESTAPVDARRASSALSRRPSLAFSPIRIGRKASSTNLSSSKHELSALMALNRVQSFLSNERTLLAWVRTACALFGLSIALATVDSPRWAPALAVVVAVVAVVCFIEGYVRHRELKRALRFTEFHLKRAHTLKPFWFSILAVFVATAALSVHTLIGASSEVDAL